MRMILLGAPGAGKGTQAILISKKYEVPHISTGDIFRFNIKNGTELGIKAKEYINKGLLVPDELTVDIIKDRLSNDDCKNGFVLDGFPRTIPQAEYLDKVLSEMGIALDVVLNIFVSDETITSRLAGRRVCLSCGMTYHIESNPPKDGKCERCNSEVVQRDDDKEETVMERLRNYHNQTEPLIKYYSSKDLVKTVTGKEEVTDTTKSVFTVLEALVKDDFSQIK